MISAAAVRQPDDPILGLFYCIDVTGAGRGGEGKGREGGTKTAAPLTGSYPVISSLFPSLQASAAYMHTYYVHSCCVTEGNRAVSLETLQ